MTIMAFTPYRKAYNMTESSPQPEATPAGATATAAPVAPPREAYGATPVTGNEKTQFITGLVIGLGVGLIGILGLVAVNTEQANQDAEFTDELVQLMQINSQAAALNGIRDQQRGMEQYYGLDAQGEAALKKALSDMAVPAPSGPADLNLPNSNGMGQMTAAEEQQLAAIIQDMMEAGIDPSQIQVVPAP